MLFRKVSLEYYLYLEEQMRILACLVAKPECNYRQLQSKSRLPREDSEPIWIQKYSEKACLVTGKQATCTLATDHIHMGSRLQAVTQQQNAVQILTLLY